jgi:hypothetical protein
MYWEPMVVEPVKANPRMVGGAGGAGAGAGAAGAWAIRWAVSTAARGRALERDMGCSRRKEKRGPVGSVVVKIRGRGRQVLVEGAGVDASPDTAIGVSRKQRGNGSNGNSHCQDPAEVAPLHWTCCFFERFKGCHDLEPLIGVFSHLRLPVPWI